MRNQADVRVPWVAAEDARLTPFTRNYPATVAELFAAFPVHAAVREIPWSRRVSIEEHTRNLGTHSYFAVMDPIERTELLDMNRTALTRLFPDGELDEPYRCGLTVVRSATPHT